MPFDNEPILLEASVSTALEIIETEAPKSTTNYFRVPPLAITSMTRSGKTTLLTKIFNDLLQEGRFNPIFVDFNGNSGFSRQDGEDDADAFLRWVATSLIYQKGEDGLTFTCDEQDLDEYLDKSPKPIVLLVDELNALTQSNVSHRLSQVLRKMFLDKPNRYLCFTSHWALELEQVVGQSVSIRGTKFVHVPRSQNEEEINTLVKSMDVTRVQVAECLGAVGLLVSIYRDETFRPEEHFNKKLLGSDVEKPFPLEPFLSEFCRGIMTHNEMRRFDEFTTRLDSGDIVWPICFAKAYLFNADEMQLRALMQHTQTAIKLPSYGTGFEWEYTARLAIAVIARCSQFRNLTPIEAKVIGAPELEQSKTRPDVHITKIPDKIKTPEEAQVHLDDCLNSQERQYPTLVVAYPEHAFFTDFDSVTCFKTSKTSGTKFTGQSMKQGKATPRKDAPFNGILLRGDGPQEDTECLTRKNWTYIGSKNIRDFLPCSLRPLMPAVWLKQ